MICQNNKIFLNTLAVCINQTIVRIETAGTCKLSLDYLVSILPVFRDILVTRLHLLVHVVPKTEYLNIKHMLSGHVKYNVDEWELEQDQKWHCVSLKVY